MSSPGQSPLPTPPDSPENQTSQSSPPQHLSSPITPSSKPYTGVSQSIQDLGSPFEVPNERRRNPTGAQKSRNITNRTDASPEEIDQYYRGQYEAKIEECLGVVRSLEKENKRLKQAPGEEYVTALEDHLQGLNESNELLRVEKESLSVSERFARARSEKLQLEVVQLQRELKDSKSAIKVSDDTGRDAKVQQLIDELHMAQDENGALYDKCTALQQENDELKSKSGADENAAERLKLVSLSKELIASEEDRMSIKTELVRLSDQLNQDIELRMLQEGTMLFDHVQYNDTLDARTQDMQEMRATIRSQQDEIEALKNGDDLHNEVFEREDNGEARSPVPSLDEELGKEIEALEQELQYTRDQLELQKAHVVALKEFRNDSKEMDTGHAADDLISKSQQLDDIVMELSYKIEDLQLQLEELKARLSEQDITDNTIESRRLVETVHQLLRDCSKMVILTNDIHNVNNEARTDLSGEDETPSKKAREVEEDRMDALGIIVEWVQDAYMGDNSSRGSQELNDQTETPGTLKDSTWSMAHIRNMLDKLWMNLNEGVIEDDDDLIWPSTQVSNPSKEQKEDNIPHVIAVANTAPPISTRLWTEMLCAGNSYWTEVALKDRSHWIKIQGPYWWSWIIQILLLLLVPSLTFAWWCIIEACIERQLWMDANEIAHRKYWDTAIWGAERGVLWKLFYGLGYI